MSLAKKVSVSTALGIFSLGLLGLGTSANAAEASYSDAQDVQSSVLLEPVSGAEALNPSAKIHMMDPQGPSKEVLEQATEAQLEAYYRSLELSQQSTTGIGEATTLGKYRSGSGSPNIAPFAEGVRCVFQVGPIDCYTARNDANTAFNTAAELYPDSTHNGPGDAFRHCYWNALMAIHINPDQAKTVADNHEELGSGPEAERQMDYKNNEIGREIGSNSPDEESAKNGCIGAVDSGRLQLAP